MTTSAPDASALRLSKTKVTVSIDSFLVSRTRMIAKSLGMKHDDLLAVVLSIGYDSRKFLDFQRKQLAEKTAHENADAPSGVAGGEKTA